MDELLAQVPSRRGWDFSRMNVLRQPVPWSYHDLVARYLSPDDSVLDIGTGGGETFSQLADIERRRLRALADGNVATAAPRPPGSSPRSSRGDRPNRLVPDASVRHNP